MNRDGFTKKTIDILAKRVGFICSNPQCRKPTIGPNELEDKVTLIGIACHITAAAVGGPRYEKNLSAIQRKHIHNGIWMCCNCATLIDKDPTRFSVKLLKKWKYNTEKEMRILISADSEKHISKVVTPFIEADLIWSSGSRSNRGYSFKNREKIESNETQSRRKQIILWDIRWKYSFILHNNSRFPAYNIRIEENSKIKFSSLTSIPKINNLPPYANLDLKATSLFRIEGDHTEADKLLYQKIPTIIEGLELNILYDDENRKTHCTNVKISNNDISNVKLC